MSNESYKSIFIHCTDYNENLIILLDSALFWAERGFHVWIITIKQIVTLPERYTKMPARDILKNMTFLTLTNRLELIDKLNNLYQWSRTPKIILVSHLDEYFQKDATSIDVSSAAICCALLTDGIQVCSKKINATAILVATFFSTNCRQILQRLIDLYFYEYIFEVTSTTSYNEVILSLRNIYSTDLRTS